MTELIRRFYDSVRKGALPPIPYREIFLTARIMDEVFAQIYPGRDEKPEVADRRSEIRDQKSEVLRQSSDSPVVTL